MEVINNISKKLRDDLKEEISSDSHLSIAAACFSIYAFDELRTELEEIEELRFIFTSPSFVTILNEYLFSFATLFVMNSRRKQLPGNVLTGSNEK